MPAASAVKPAFPFLDLKAQYANIRDEVNSAVEGVFESQIFIMGPEVSAFEEEVKAAGRVRVRFRLCVGL